jgi:predicted GIY-YIG superfamily endonuclease
MAGKLSANKLDKNSIRNWTLYVLKFSDGHFYIGITSRKDFMTRIRQHGGPLGARVNLNKKIEEIVELQHLGKLPRITAEQIENNVTLQYRKNYGSRKVTGGYNLYGGFNIIPTFTPGSIQSYIFVLSGILIALVLMLVMARLVIK